MELGIMFNIKPRFHNVDLSTLGLTLSQLTADYTWERVVIMKVIS